MTDKFCKDCKHSRGEGERMACDSPKNSHTNEDVAQYLVTGIKRDAVNVMLSTACHALRAMEKHPSLGVQLCGRAGNWFEQK